MSYRRSTTTATGSRSAKTEQTHSVTKDALSQEEVDKILDKIAEKGYEGLTKEEKRKLFEYSKK